MPTEPVEVIVPPVNGAVAVIEHDLAGPFAARRRAGANRGGRGAVVDVHVEVSARHAGIEGGGSGYHVIVLAEESGVQSS